MRFLIRYSVSFKKSVILYILSSFSLTITIISPFLALIALLIIICLIIIIFRVLLILECLSRSYSC
jgi:hypothetical protein